MQICREALRIREQLVAEHPDNVSYQRLLLVMYGHLGDMLARENRGLGRNKEAVSDFEKTAAIADRLSQRDPSDMTSLFDVIAAHMRTGSSLLHPPADAVKALVELNRAEVNLSKLNQMDPGNQRYRVYAVTLDRDTGRALWPLGRKRDAVRWIEQAAAETRSIWRPQ